ncbi:pyrophosphatase [Brachybacterium sp. AOP25-B2-12]|uniref:pyrophosphatase n=1 Tax=Brachybacterium sp. AOP25-B2-12 TaxID=3457710 RepID=UPI0040339C4A
MDFITDYPLGDDIAWTLLALVLVGVVAIVLGVVVPGRLGRTAPVTASADVDDADDEGTPVDPGLGARLGALLSGSTATALVIGIPALLLLLLVPGSLDSRLLSSGMMLAGLLAGVAVTWRTTGMLVPALALGGVARRRAVGRVGALMTATSISVAAVPVGIAVWFLRDDAGRALLGFAAGAALFALSTRVSGAFADVTADSSALLAGADENELDRAGADNPGAVHVRFASLFRRGPARAADIMAATSALLALGLWIGVTTFTVEGMIVPLLGVGIAILAALLVAVLPQARTVDREREGLRLGALIPSVLGVGAFVAAVLVWLPEQYKALRFGKVGLDTFTDPALTGGQAVKRSELEPQIEQTLGQLKEAIPQLSGGADGRSILDTVGIYGVHPGFVTVIAIATGAILALLAQALVSFAADRRGGAVLSAARTARTGGPLGVLTSLGTAGRTTAILALLVALAFAVLGITGAGILQLVFLLAVFAGVGALVIVAGHAAFHTAPLLGDVDGADQGLRDASRGADVTSGAGLQVVTTFAAAATLAPVANAVFAAGNATTLWEDRALTDTSASSLLVVAGLVLGVVTVLAVGANLFEGLRRLGAAAVVDTRAALLDGGSGAVALGELDLDTRRAAVAPLLVAVFMPVVVGFGLGAAAVPAYVAGALVAGLIAGVWATLVDSSQRGALDVIETGRYGGRGSWAHSAALSGATLGTGLRAAFGQLALPVALVTSLSSALLIGSFIDLSTGDVTYHLRWLIAVAAIIVVGGALVLATVTVPEPDLEDISDLDEPLFARGSTDREDDLLSEGWDAFTDEDEADREEVIVTSRRTRGRKGAAKASTDDEDAAAPRAKRTAKSALTKRSTPDEDIDEDPSGGLGDDAADDGDTSTDPADPAESDDASAAPGATSSTGTRRTRKRTRRGGARRTR